MTDYIIAIHGGAGTILKSLMTAEKEKLYKVALQDALDQGIKILRNGGSALDAVVHATSVLEDCPLFNAGKGSVFTHDGGHEMDASVMNGSDLKAGAVAGVRNIKNPVLHAKAVMNHSEHVFLFGAGAEEFARKERIEFESDEYFFEKCRYDQLLEIRDSDQVRLDHSNTKFGTVGAVARDVGGNLAAATSTGGMTNKRYGRVGDSPIIGAGTYANNNTCAVSCTGHGEYFIRSVVAYDVSCLMEYKGMTLQQACDEVVMKKLKNMDGEGGLIAIDKLANCSMVFNSEGMYRGFQDADGRNEIMIYKS
ncbi:MAG: isoaspartyl peptidase/L-asparaginase [Bacteroidetes bacterium]|nr:MAG: isoaspartyl peptidase/L-asparaginase [Bacteroidota bacterium]REJ99690.1 MAG: isoaspartyl peptidase/L-asparaginase [Bacteroidota bacterium]REK33923.1 MAG: isoaspartyl peptidase/L-asparaginase [Bacteroidota bacterium]REK47689.1 MAG: isoaspartyl peptidase/L-asparaginase [Bacteroidota bacterium]